MRTQAFLLAAALLGAAAPGYAQSAPEITRLSASADDADSSMFVQGSVVLGGEEPVTLGTDAQGDSSPSAFGFSGHDARALAVWLPNASDPTLTFAMSLWDLQVPLPEVNAWRWTFLTAGNKYRLEAIRGGLTADSATEDPTAAVEAADYVNGTFRLLGPCSAPPTEPFEDLTCPLITTLDGQIDPNSDRILWQVPRGTGGLFGPGSSISPAPEGAVSEVRVGPQRYRDLVTQAGTYTIRTPTIRVGLQDSSVNCPPNCPDPSLAALSTEAWLTPPQESDGYDFMALISLTGIPRGGTGPDTFYRVVAEACVGSSCSQRVAFDIQI